MSPIKIPNNIEAGEFGQVRGWANYGWADGAFVGRRPKFFNAESYYYVRADGENVEILAEYCNPSDDTFQTGKIELGPYKCLTRQYDLFEKNGSVYSYYGLRRESLPGHGDYNNTREKFGRLTIKETWKLRQLLNDMAEAGESESTVGPILAWLGSCETSIALAASDAMAGRLWCDPDQAEYCKYLNPIIELYNRIGRDDQSWQNWLVRARDGLGTEEAVIYKDFESEADSYRILVQWKMYESLSFNLYKLEDGIEVEGMASIDIDPLGNVKPVSGESEFLNFLRNALIAWADVDLEFKGCFGSPADVQGVLHSLPLAPYELCDQDHRYIKLTIGRGRGWKNYKIPSLEADKNRPLNGERDASIDDEIIMIADENYPYYEGLYHYFHQYPEVAHNEQNTADVLAEELADLGFAVTTNFAGNGVVAVMENGDGPTTLIRAEMDALPVQEETGLSYQSLVPNVMHACGHDVHMAILLGAAQALAELKGSWRGTLVLVGQPSEEVGDGAREMIEAGLFELFPSPDQALSVHVSASKPAGSLTFRKGYSLANVDYVDVTFTGPGGHGAMPEAVANPIDLASQFDRELHAFVEKIGKTSPAVVSIGSFHGGTEHNVIPKEVHLQMTSRSYDGDVRQRLEDGIRSIAESITDTAKAPRPKVDYRKGVPSLYNDPALVSELVPVFEGIVGREDLFETKPKMFGDDFSYYGYGTGVPIFQFGLGVQPGGTDPKSWPQAHSPKFAPEFEDPFLIGVMALTRAVIELSVQAER